MASQKRCALREPPWEGKRAKLEEDERETKQELEDLGSIFSQSTACDDSLPPQLSQSSAAESWVPCLSECLSGAEAGWEAKEDGNTSIKEDPFLQGMEWDEPQPSCSDGSCDVKLEEEPHPEGAAPVQSRALCVEGPAAIAVSHLPEKVVLNELKSEMKSEASFTKMEFDSSQSAAVGSEASWQLTSESLSWQTLGSNIGREMSFKQEAAEDEEFAGASNHVKEEMIFVKQTEGLMQHDPSLAPAVSGHHCAQIDSEQREEIAARKARKSDRPGSCKRDDSTGESLIARIRSGELKTVAPRMTDFIGISDSDWMKMQPKEVPTAFLGRYMGSGDRQYHYEHASSGKGSFIATLVTPGFFQRRFRGRPKQNRHEAEVDACRVFQNDKEVNEARRLLPPSMQKIRQRASLSSAQKESLTARGYDVTLVQKDMLIQVYNGFRDLGCRNSMWDSGS